jgi:hypothetical protein
MPLVLDASVGGVASNAYVDVATAVAVASYRVGGAGFVALTSDQQIQALVTATRDIDSIEAGVSPGFIGGFLGTRATDTQALQWPRGGTPYSGLPPDLLGATIELAISYTPLFAAGATGDALNEDPNVGNIKTDKTDVLQTEYFAARFIAPYQTPANAIQRFPAVVQRLLLSLVVVASSAWRAGTATVSRGS